MLIEEVDAAAALASLDAAKRHWHQSEWPELMKILYEVDREIKRLKVMVKPAN